jgi:hypothetical protein
MIDKFMTIQNDNSWKETNYENVKNIIIPGFNKAIHPFMRKFKEAGEWMCGQPDENLLCHYKLSDCNTYIKNIDQSNKNKHNFKVILQIGLENNNYMKE